MVWDAPTGVVMNSAHHVCSGRTHSEIPCLAEFVRLVCLGTKNRDKILYSEPRTKELIITGPDTLTQLGLAAAINNNVLVIVGRGCRLNVSKRRFHPVSFPGLDGVEARLVRFGEGEIVINKTVLIPIFDPTDNHRNRRPRRYWPFSP